MHFKFLFAWILLFSGGNATSASDLAVKDSILRESAPEEGSWRIINKGAGGNNSLDLLARLDRDVLSENPDMVFILAGMHDMINLHKFLDYGTFRKSYQKIINKLKDEGIETVLMSLTPVDTNAISGRYELSFFDSPPLTRIQRANEIIADLAKVNGLPMIDLYQEFVSRKSPNPGKSSLIRNLANSGKADGVHPTSEGNRIIAEQIFNFLVAKGKIREKKSMVFFGDSITFGQGVKGSGTSQGQTFPAYLKKMVQWDELAPYFSIPYVYEEVEGNFSDPFVFDDGHVVTDLADWKERRKEILQKWHGMMGKWPEMNTQPTFEILDTKEKEYFVQKKIRFEWVPGQWTEGYLLLPYGAKNRPAVVTVYYEPETAIGEGKPNRDFALQLAKRGFVTLSLGTTATTENQTYSIYYPHIDSATVQPLSMLAYAAGNAWHLLASLPEVDKEKIGITGHSYGGKWAMFASCLFEKYAAAAWSDPGIVFDETRTDINYWEPWYLGYHPRPWRNRGIPTEENPAKGLYPELVKNGMNLHELHVLMAPRPFLVSGGSEDSQDRWVPLNYSLRANNFFGVTNRVGMSNRPDHSPNPESNEIIYSFFEYYLAP
ncbi:GDSL-type esterase/lipase family protein [Cyclobacterium jeungdonense]|uniref:GDSL-type esterase/lipase family protein n=1 Tax=Cyclobacterium jeungdonense TaxID=708087 RepID=A0ABT8C9Y8_9BACT|nr:GDSL-type esterase/lipase family protein [Cyclobacterium jeungdonense]MDN3688829.1 GDSL-type esterase/lipase family protein [Cyclobacterium jeungdonense]